MDFLERRINSYPCDASFRLQSTEHCSFTTPYLFCQPGNSLESSNFLIYFISRTRTVQFSCPIFLTCKIIYLLRGKTGIIKYSHNLWMTDPHRGHVVLFDELNAGPIFKPSFFEVAHAQKVLLNPSSDILVVLDRQLRQNSAFIVQFFEQNILSPTM